MSVEDLLDEPLWVDTGADQLLVPLRSADAVRRARCFFTVASGAVGEDPGTGSACANLGGWLIWTARALPATYGVEQGDEIGRPCRLRLEVDRDRQIRVGGRVLELEHGVIEL